ncbi:MAG: UDP-N-acetylmuramate--L-alanine ligase [Bacillota bacterium]|nr:UDP-N-acetylmuramate--L-alanine ligase [Bacillota bacterium]
MATDSGQWIHMVGIGGAGMSGIARVLREQGYKVSGSDLKRNGISSRLEQIGIEVHEGHSSSNLKEGVDLLVISSAIPQDNIEVKEARCRNIPIMKRGQMLASMVNESTGIAVAGAHGKTTTTSMLYTVLVGCGLDPSFIVGGEIQGNQLNARLGEGKYFVVEADESDASFLELKPYVAVITNIENDHLDFYKSFERIQNAFCQFINQVHPQGIAVMYGEDRCIQDIQRSVQARVVLYGEDTSFDYSLKDWTPMGLGSSFSAFHHNHYLGTVELSVPGKHNALNALAALATAMELGQDFDEISRSLKRFIGTKRRFQIMGKTRGITVVDDYAHHPTEIMATIDAAQQTPHDRVVVVFQPHRYSRTKILAEQFGRAFSKADLVVVTDVYSAGENPIPGVSGELVYQAALESGCNVHYISQIEDIKHYLNEELRENDLMITMGAGDIWKLAASIVEGNGI